MGQQLSAAGAEGQNGERCTEKSIPVAAWRRAQLQNSRELQLENSRSSGDNGSGNNGEGGLKSGSPGNAGKRPNMKDVKDFSSKYPAAKIFSGPGVGSGSIGGGCGSSENSCGSGDGSSEIGSGRNSSNSADTDLGRMSVRAAIDSFIENCLSARSDPPTGPQVNLSSITGIMHKNDDDKVINDKNVPDDDEKNNCDENKRDNKENLNDRKKEGENSVEQMDSLSSKDDNLVRDMENKCKNNTVDKIKNGSSFSNIGEDNDRMNDNEGILVIDCDNDEDDSGNNNNTSEKKSNIATDKKSSSADKDDTTNQSSKQPPIPTDSPHVIDVDNEDFSTPPGVLFPNGRKTQAKNTNFESYKRQLEKKTFSDFLQDRLMAQIESNELQSRGSSNVLSWEVSNSNTTPNNPPTLSVPGKGSSATSAGPVRLQTLIDKVLDQSLNKDSKIVNVSNNKSTSAAVALPNVSASSSSLPSASSAPAKGYPNKFEGTTRVKINTMCFKEHIEKVLEENFRTYGEEENEMYGKQKEENKSVPDNSKSPDIEFIKESTVSSENSNQKSGRKFDDANGSGNSGRVGPDGTISVQDIVDRVISQTEVISKLLTPGQEQNKSGSTASAQDSSNRNTAGNSNSTNSPSQKAQGKQSKSDQYPSGGPSGNSSRPGLSGRKRGRPRLGSPNRSTKSSDKNSHNNESRSPLQHQRMGYPSQSLPQNTLSSCSSQVRARLGQGPPPLDYVPPQRLPGMPALVSPQGVIPPPISYHQNQNHPVSSHHHSQQQQHSPYYNSAPSHSSSASSGPSQSSLPSIPRSSPGSSTTAYPSHPHHRNYPGGLTAHHHPSARHQGHHGPPQPHNATHHPTHHSQQRSAGSPPPSLLHKRYPDAQNPESKPLPLLVMADHVNSGGPGPSPASSNPHPLHHHHNSSSPRYIAVSHTPTPSCSCEVCVETFSSRNRSPSHHQHPHNPQQRVPGSNAPPQHSPSLSSASSTYPPSLGQPKHYIQRQDVHPSHHHPNHYHPYHQGNPASTRRNSFSNGVNNPTKEPLKPVFPANSGGKQFPPQAIVPSYVVSQRLYQDPSSPGVTPSNPYSNSDHHEDETFRRRSSSFTDPSRPSHLNSSQYPHPPHHLAHHRKPSDDNYLPDSDRPVDLRPVDLHKPMSSHRNPQSTPLAAPSSSSPPLDNAQPLDLSVKPSSKKIKPVDATYPERRMSHSDLDPQGHNSGQASYPAQSLDNNVERNLPYQKQPQFQHQSYHHHTSPPSMKVPSPGTVVPQPHSHDGSQQLRHGSNPEGIFHPSHLKHIESPTTHPSGSNSGSSSHPHNTYSPYQQPQGSNNTTPLNPGESSTPNTFIPVPPHLRRNSSSSGENPAQEGRSHHHRPGDSPYLESNHAPKADLDLPITHAYQPHRNPEDCPPPSSLSSTPDNKSTNGDYQYPPPQHQRPPPPLMKPSTHPAPPTPPQQQQQQQPGAPPLTTAPNNTNSINNDDQDSLKHVSRHEPIQNIIGNHPQNDILYLICKLCRQTYGSPYGFRKHFRNQHGFEPKVEHTIVQTISATKTAMSHNNISEGGGGVGYDEPKLGNSEDRNNSQYPLDRQIKTENPDNCSVDDFNSNQIAAYNRAQEHVKIIFKQGSGEGSPVNMENAKVLECPECGQTFQLNDFGSYKRHCRQHSMVQSSGPFSCHDCHRSFAEPGQLEQHLNTHNTFTPSVCGICRTFFSSPHYLAEHLQAAHGHVLPSEAMKSPGNKSESLLSPGSGKQERQSSDMPQVSQFLDIQTRIEHALLLENELENSSANRSFSKSPVEPKSPSAKPLASPVAQKRSSPPLSFLPPTKRHKSSTSSSPTSSMFTVLTPKKLEVQKRPADPVVSSAIPDSSFDDRTKLTSSTTVTTAVDSSNSLSNSSPIPFIKFPRDSSGTPIPSGRRSEDSNKSSTKSPSIGDMKTGKESERCASVDSNNSDSNSNISSFSASITSSPSVDDDAQVFYKHKKYSRHLKRRLSGENNINSNSGGTGKEAMGTPPSSTASDSKMPKQDKKNINDKKGVNSSSVHSGDKETKGISSAISSLSSSTTSSSASAVSSSVNTSVRKEDCQSSCLTSSSSSKSSSSQNKSSRSGKNSKQSSSPYNKFEKAGKVVKDKTDKNKNRDSDVKKKNESKV